VTAKPATRTPVPITGFTPALPDRSGVLVIKLHGRAWLEPGGLVLLHFFMPEPPHLSQALEVAAPRPPMPTVPVPWQVLHAFPAFVAASCRFSSSDFVSHRANFFHLLSRCYATSTSRHCRRISYHLSEAVSMISFSNSCIPDSVMAYLSVAAKSSDMMRSQTPQRSSWKFESASGV